jgi:hypothetical protein
VGLYPLLDGDRCWWLAADFDGQAAMLDALAYLKAARAVGVPAALEVSRSGVGAHIWIFFTEPITALVARKLGSRLLGRRWHCAGGWTCQLCPLFPPGVRRGRQQPDRRPLRPLPQGRRPVYRPGQHGTALDQWDYAAVDISPAGVTVVGRSAACAPGGHRPGPASSTAIKPAAPRSCEPLGRHPHGDRRPDTGPDVTLKRGVDAGPDLLREAAARLDLGHPGPCCYDGILRRLILPAAWPTPSQHWSPRPAADWRSS